MHLSLHRFLLIGLGIFNSVAQGAAQAPNVVSVEAQLATQTEKAHSNLANDAEIKRLLEQGQISQAIELLESRIKTYEHDPAYFNLLGTLYSLQKSFAQAAAAFERVTLIEPDNAGAWLDLAIANAEAGQFRQAAQFFDYIENEFHPNEKLLGLIDSYRQQMKKRTQVNAAWHTQASFQLGYDTNANSGLADSRIVVQLGGKDIELPLEQARPDMFRLLSMATRYQGKWWGQNLMFNAQLASKNFNKEHGFSTLDLASGLSLSHRFSAFDLGASVNVEHFDLGGKALLNSTASNLYLEKALGSCFLNTVFEFEERRYATAKSLNANSVWQNLALGCNGKLDTVRVQMSVIARNGIDRPIQMRAGGITHRHETIVKMTYRLNHTWQLDTSYNYALANDSEGYSPLISNNAVRHVARRGLRLQLQTYLKDDWVLLMGLERNVNDSNLSLFRQKGNSLSLGLLKNF